MSPSKNQKAQETRAENRAEYARQVIKINANWTLKRSDEMNWSLIHKDSAPWYYGRLVDAINDIPHKLLNEGDKKSLQDIAEQLDSIRKTIERLDLKFLKELQGGEMVSI